MERVRGSGLKTSFAFTILCLLTWGLQAQTQGGGDLVFLVDQVPPGIYVAPADTLNFTLIPGLDDPAVRTPFHIGYDHVDQMVYWADGSRINRAFLNGTGVEVVMTNLPGTYGMSLDVENRVMYWTSSNRLIERATLDGQNREVVISFASPTGVLVDPINSHLYWTEVDENASIQRSATDGSDSIVLVNTDLSWPYSLALDLKAGRLYWCDSVKHRVESSDLLGHNRSVVIDMAFGNSISPIGIGIHNEHLLFTSNRYPSVLRVNLMTASVDESLSTSFGEPRGLHVYKDTDDCNPNPCMNEGTCTDGVNSFTCTCVAGYEGADCGTNTDDCSPNPCMNGGTCTDGVNSFTCACVTGYEGADCGTSTDDCSPNPCMNDGTCIDGISGFTCNCVAGYTDITCSTIVPMSTLKPTRGELQTAASTAQPLTGGPTTEVSTQSGPDVVVIAVVCVVVVAVMTLALVLFIWCQRFRKHSRRHTAKPQPSDEPAHSSDDGGGQELKTYVNDVIREDGESHPPTSLVYEEIGGPSSCEVVCAGSLLDDEDVGLPFWAKPWSIPWDHFMVTTKVVDDGYFGEVRLGSVMIDEEVTKAAIKTLKTTSKENFMKDFETLTQIGRHPNVVGLLGACQHEDVLYVALEYLPIGNLRSYLRDARSMELESQMALVSRRLIQFALDVAKGMLHLATSGVIHRDLAARNIFLSDDLVAKVSNFGLSRGEDIYVQKSKGRVPIRWLSLESLFSKTYFSMSDVWSFGILLWEIATLGGTPYEGINSKDLPSRLKNGYRMPKPSNCDDEIYDLMQQCWQEDPKDRPPFKKLVSVLASMANDDETYMWLLPKAENYTYVNIRPEMDDN